MNTSVQGFGGDPGLRSLRQIEQRTAGTMAKLASQRRIATAADDAAGLAIARRLEADERGLARGERNLQDGVDLTRTAEGALASAHDLLARMRELSVAARNGAMSDADRATIQDEYDQLAEQIDQNAAGARFGDAEPLLDGSRSGAAAPAVTDGRGEAARLDLPDARAAALGVAGRDVAAPSTVDALAAAIEKVAAARSQLGTSASGLERAAAASAAARESEAAARSRIEDADLAQEVANRTRDRILHDLQLSGIRVGRQTADHAIDLLG